MDTCIIYLFLQVLAFGVCNGHRTQCYSCHPSKSNFFSQGGDSFPDCLNKTPFRCLDTQTCQVRYHPGNGQIQDIGCDSFCSFQPNVNHDGCAYGGSRHHDVCDVCCYDDACVTNMIKQLTGNHTQPATTQVPPQTQTQAQSQTQRPERVFCPDNCNVGDRDKCLSRGVTCGHGQFCDLRAQYGTHIIGYCQPVSDKDRCDRSMTHNHCLPGSDPNGQLQMVVNIFENTDYCTIDCCTDDTCIHTHFSTYKMPDTTTTTTSTSTTTTRKTTGPSTTMATTTKTTTTTTVPTTSETTTPTTTTTTSTTPTTPTTPTTVTTSTPTTSSTTTTSPATTTTTPATTTTSATVAPTESLDLFKELKTNCRDHLVLGTCVLLQQQKNVCLDPLSQTLCPQTCGICQEIINANCTDTVLNGGCQDLKATTNVCQNALAIYTCPETCGICDNVIRDILRKFQTGELQG